MRVYIQAKRNLTRYILLNEGDKYEKEEEIAVDNLKIILTD